MTDKLTFIKDPEQLTVRATSPNGNSIKAQSVTALLLFDIRHLLDEIRMGLIDVENTIDK